MHWRALKKTKEEIISYLQMYLSNIDNYRHLIPSELSEEHFEVIRVYDTEPEELRVLPVIILNSGSGDMVTAGIGDMAQELYSDDGELVGYRYGGIYEFNLVLEVGTKTTFSREFLTDLITKALRFQLRRKLEREGILIKNMRFAGESKIQYGSDSIFVSTINFSTWSEWYEDIELLPIEDVNINFNN